MPPRFRKTCVAAILFAAFNFALGRFEYAAGNSQSAKEDIAAGVITVLCPGLLYIFMRHNAKNPTNPIRYWQQVCCAALVIFVVILCSLFMGVPADFYVGGFLLSWLLLCLGCYYYLHDRERIQHKYYDEPL
jgi:predicted neutral ceramidase superfamily lipid hydrolase